MRSELNTHPAREGAQRPRAFVPYARAGRELPHVPLDPAMD